MLITNEEKTKKRVICILFHIKDNCVVFFTQNDETLVKGNIINSSRLNIKI